MAKQNLSRKEKLLQSKDMAPVQGTVDINVPLPVLWQAFRRANLWSRWNPCFFWARNKNLVLGDQLVWAFQPIRWWYLYKMFAIAKIVELEDEKKVTWEVTALPGFYAQHTYHVQDLGDGRSRFGSWEQAMGWGFRLLKFFWISHFTFVKDKSLEGAQYLEYVYRRDNKIDDTNLKPRNYWPFRIAMILLALLLAAGGVAGWFYTSYVRLNYVDLAPGVQAVLGGGGNSLVVGSGSDVLLVDTKFPPAAGWLNRRLARDGGPPSKVVNTHYHYDHTQGNVEYAGAAIYAFNNVPELMKKRDPDLWAEAASGIPNNLVGDQTAINAGDQELTLNHPGPAHTHGDLWVSLRAGGREIIATGDLVFHTYYPFMDLGEGGVDIPGLIRTVRDLAARYPNATFVPGHGPVATAQDLVRYANYLQFLNDAVADARQRGSNEDQAVEQIDLSQFGLSKLPSFHGGFCWATAANNIRWVYRIQTGAGPDNLPCSFWR